MPNSILVPLLALRTSSSRPAKPRSVRRTQATLGIGQSSFPSTTELTIPAKDLSEKIPRGSFLPMTIATRIAMSFSST
jgi:hypothetical protein